MSVDLAISLSIWIGTAVGLVMMILILSADDIGSPD